jgi:16S rRNA (guanine966-N2)-methyltransferase
LRIISGWAGGRKLFTPPGRTQEIRPTSDRAREALFNILGNAVAGMRVLDLYAGTGALGLEALSRGAHEVILVDFHRQSLDLIQRNIAVCKPETQNCSAKIIRFDLRKGLPSVAALNATNAKFDLIFLDPPYSQGLSLKTLECLGNGLLIHEDTIVIAEERSSESMPEHCGVLSLTDQRSYGDTGFWFYSIRQPENTPVKES